MKKLLFIILAFSFITTSFSQNIEYFGAPFLKNYSKLEYHASSQNWDITQDSRGIMYVANTSALLEFDGTDWRGYTIAENSIVRTISIDEQGKIWTAGFGEFGYSIPDSIGNLKYFSVANKLPDSLREIGDVARIFTQKDEVYLIASNKINIWKNNKLSIIKVSLIPSFATKIHDKIYVIDENKGIGFINNLSIKYLPNINKENFGSRYVSICEYSKNEILISTTDAGFYIYNTKTFKLEKQKTDPKILKYLKENIGVYALAKGKNSYAIGTFMGGILILDKNLKLTDVVNEERGLENNCIYSLYFDRNNDLWAGTQNGISYINMRTPIHKYEKKQNINAAVMDAILFNKRKYISTLQGAYYLNEHTLNASKDNHKFKRLKEIEISWNIDTINNKLFAAGRDGIFQIVDTTVKVTKSMPGETVVSIGKTRKFPNYILYANSNTKFGYFEIENQNNSSFVKAKNEGIFNDIKYKIQNIVADKNGNLWLSTIYSKIIFVQFTGNSIKDYKVTIFDEKNNLPTGNILNVFFINDSINITTPKGIYKPAIYKSDFLHDSLTTFEHDKSWGKYYTSDSTYCTNIHQINKNKYFIGGHPPVFLTKLKDSVIIDKKPLAKVEPGVRYIVEKGFINALSSNSFLIYNMNKKVEQNQYKTLIRAVVIGKDSTIFLGNFFKQNNNELLPIYKQEKHQIPIVEYINNSFVFHFAAIFYEETEKIEYSYFIEGFSKEWSNWNTENKATFTNIPEGKYTFKVKAKNIYEIESKITEYKFKVLPPWYRTILAYIFYAIFAILLVWLIVKLNTKRLIAEKQRLENIVTERTAEIYQQKEEIQTQADNLREQAVKMTEINQELEKLSIVASKTDNAILIFNNNLNLEWVNESYSRIYGYTIEEILETGKFNILERSNNEKIKPLVEKAISENKSIIYETKNKTKNNEIKWVQTTLTPIFENKKLSKLIAIESDITEIHKAKEVILSKNEQIESSINYAQTIQQASLPTEEQLQKYLNYFLLFKPKDIVSGDFYWFSKLSENEYIIAEIDCTGHGVPGAFMSLIGSTLLNEIVNYKKITEPAKILTELDILVKKALNQEHSDNLDGMDLSLCKYTKLDNGNTKITFSGAKQDLLCYIKEDKAIKILKGDRKNIGGFLRKLSNEKDFTNQEITLKKGDMLYMLSDGYADQNNLKRRKIGTRNLIEKLNEIAEAPLAIQKNTLFLKLADWQGTEAQRDDITVIGIRI